MSKLNALSCQNKEIIARILVQNIYLPKMCIQQFLLAGLPQAVLDKDFRKLLPMNIKHHFDAPSHASSSVQRD